MRGVGLYLFSKPIYKLSWVNLVRRVHHSRYHWYRAPYLCRTAPQRQSLRPDIGGRLYQYWRRRPQPTR